MTVASALAALADALPADSIEEHAPLDIDGAQPTATLRPVDGAAAGAALAALARGGLAALVRGGGTRFPCGNPPRRGDVVLSTERIVGVDEFEPGEGVCHALAGTVLADLRTTVAEHGWELPLDSPGARSTVGGVLAAAALGPRAQGFGPVRDAVLGLEVVLASGERTHCGGRVVKNVTGYDLNKLYTGSFGTLGVIEGAWLRLRPAPERTLTLAAVLPNADDACARGLVAARRAATRSCAIVADSAGVRLVVELAGAPAGVAGDAAWLRASADAVDAEDDALDGIRALQGSVPDGGLRFRLAVLPSRLDAVLAAVRAAGATALAYPGLGLLYAFFPPAANGETPPGQRAFRAVSAAARDARGGFVCEAAPLAVKRACEMFGEPSPAQELFRALKQRFDPEGVLNPGCFAGGL